MAHQTIRLAMAGLALFGWAASLDAQHRPARADSITVGQALAAVRLGSPGVASQILGQRIGAHSQQAREALADSLAELAMAYRLGDELLRRRAAGAAVSALGIAGSSLEPVPFVPAFDRLARIVEQGPNVGIRAGALWTMPRLHHQAPVLPFLRRIATTDDQLAHNAVELLALEMGPPGLAVLRELYRSGTVVDARARSRLLGLAEDHGWR
jgi:hypothetical protein